jgi:rsbT co-antagonist protein RsbR
LLGSQTILSGISPMIAKTIVNLGINISAMHTRNKLAEALELAFEIVGKQVKSVRKKQSASRTLATRR